MSSKSGKSATGKASANQAFEKQPGNRRTSIDATPTTRPRTRSSTASARPTLLPAPPPPPRTPVPLQPSRTRNLSPAVPAVAEVPQYQRVYGDQFGTYRNPPVAASPPGAASPSSVAVVDLTSPVGARGYGDQFGRRRSSVVETSPSAQVSKRAGSRRISVAESESPTAQVDGWLGPILPVRGPAARVVSPVRGNGGQSGMSGSPTASRSPIPPGRGQVGACGSPPTNRNTILPVSQTQSGTNTAPVAIPISSSQVHKSLPAITSPSSQVSRARLEADNDTPPAIQSPQVSLPSNGQFGTNNTTPAPIASPIPHQVGTYYDTLPNPNPQMLEGYYADNQYGMYSEPPAPSSRYEYAGGNRNGNRKGQGSTEIDWKNHIYPDRPPIVPRPSSYSPNGVPAEPVWNPSTPGRQETVQFGTLKRRAFTVQNGGYSPESAQTRQASMSKSPGRALSRVRQRNESPNVGSFDLGHRYTPQKGREPNTNPEESFVAGVPEGVPSLAAVRSKAVADLLNEDFVIRLPQKSKPNKRHEPDSDLSDQDFVVRKTPNKSKKPKKTKKVPARIEPVAELSDEDFVMRRPNTRRSPNIDPNIDPSLDPSLDPALATSRVEFQNSTSVERARSREKSVEETPRGHHKTPSTTENGAIRQSDDSALGAPRSREQSAGSPSTRERTRGELSYHSSDEETLVDSEVDGLNRE